MKMPSLFRYFAVVGSALLGLLWIVNYFVDEPAPTRRAEAPKILVQHEPGASLIERWRDNEAAMKAFERTAPAPVVALNPQPATEPAQKVAPVSLTTAAATEVSPAKPAKAERPRKTQVVRERIKPPLPILAQEQADAAKQDQYYAQSRQYQPRPVFGPFGQTW